MDALHMNAARLESHHRHNHRALEAANERLAHDLRAPVVVDAPSFLRRAWSLAVSARLQPARAILEH